MKNCGPHSTQLARLSLSVAASAHNTHNNKSNTKNIGIPLLSFQPSSRPTLLNLNWNFFLHLHKATGEFCLFSLKPI